VLFFDPYNNNTTKLEYIKVYKCLQQGLRAFEFNKEHLKQLEKPLKAQD